MDQSLKETHQAEPKSYTIHGKCSLKYVTYVYMHLHLIPIHFLPESVIVNPEGVIVGKHRKVHLFDIDVPGN